MSQLGDMARAAIGREKPLVVVPKNARFNDLCEITNGDAELIDLLQDPCSALLKRGLEGMRGTLTEKDRQFRAAQRKAGREIGAADRQAKYLGTLQAEIEAHQ